MRLAVYFVPADDSALAHFGNAVLGRDALGRTLAPAGPAGRRALAPVAPAGGRVSGSASGFASGSVAGAASASSVDAAPEPLPAAPAEWIRGPARYGFHATLKAPFELADGTTESDVADACAVLAARHAALPMPALAPAAYGGFTALLLPVPDPRVDALAADCVTALERYRAPLDGAAFARRRPERLDPAARARLERWGYPHVLDGFRFHMTLSGTLEPTPEVERWRAALARRYAALVGTGAVLDRLALCREGTPGGMFVRVAEFPLRRSIPKPG